MIIDYIRKCYITITYIFHKHSCCNTCSHSFEGALSYYLFVRASESDRKARKDKNAGSFVCDVNRRGRAYWKPATRLSVVNDDFSPIINFN